MVSALIMPPVGSHRLGADHAAVGYHAHTHTGGPVNEDRKNHPADPIDDPRLRLE